MVIKAHSILHQRAVFSVLFTSIGTQHIFWNRTKKNVQPLPAADVDMLPVILHIYRFNFVSVWDGTFLSLSVLEISPHLPQRRVWVCSGCVPAPLRKDHENRGCTVSLRFTLVLYNRTVLSFVSEFSLNKQSNIS